MAQQSSRWKRSTVILALLVLVSIGLRVGVALYLGDVVEAEAEDRRQNSLAV